MVLRGVIEFIKQTHAKFSLCDIYGRAGDKYTDVKRFQQYGLQTFPLPIEEDSGCEVIYSGDTGENVIIAENDPRYRRTLSAGEVALFTHRVDQEIILSPVNRNIKIQSDDKTRINLDDSGLMTLTNEIAELELSIAHIKASIGIASRTTTTNSVVDVVGSSMSLMKPDSFTSITEDSRILANKKFTVVAPDISFHGKTKIIDGVFESGIIDGDVKIVPKGQNTLASTPITFEDAMIQVAQENGGSTDVGYLEDALSSGQITVNGSTTDTYAKTVAKARADEAFDKGVLGVNGAATAQIKADTAFDKGVLGIAGAATAQSLANTNQSDITTKEQESINRDNALQSGLNALGASVDGKIVSFVQNGQPSNAQSSEGDLWFDLDDGYKIHTYKNGAWLATQDSAIATAIANASTANGNAGLAQATADSKVVTFFQDNSPTTGTVGDLWIDTNDANKMYRHNGSTWALARDSGIGQAITNAGNAQATANTALSNANSAQTSADRVQTFRQNNQPAVGFEGDIWIDTNANNKSYRYDGSSWIHFRDTTKDGSINGAISTANSAYTKAEAVRVKSLGFTRAYNSSTSKYEYTFSSDVVKAHGGFLAQGSSPVSGQPTTALFNWNSTTSYGVLARGTVAAGRFEMATNGTGSTASTLKSGIHGIGNAGNNIGVQGTANQANSFAGYFVTSYSSSIGCYVAKFAATDSFPALKVTGGASGTAINATGKVKVSGGIYGNLIGEASTARKLFPTSTATSSKYANELSVAYAANAGKLGGKHFTNYRDNDDTFWHSGYATSSHYSGTIKTKWLRIGGTDIRVLVV